MLEQTHYGRTVRRLLEDEETKSLTLAVFTIAGLSVGWAAGSVAAGEPVGDQAWLLVVLAGLTVTVTELTDDLETEA